MSEIKYVVSALNFNNDVNAFTSIDITPVVPQGVDKNQRIGNKIKYKMLTVRIWFHIASGINAVDFNAKVVRLCILQLRTTLTAPVALTDFFDNGTFNSTVSGTQVRVMFDKCYCMVPALDPNQIAPGNPMKIFKKLHFKVNNNVTFKSVANTEPTDLKDQYYLLLLTDDLGSGLNRYNMQGNVFTRMSYIDL